MKNVPVPGPPPVESKLLHEMPSPSSDWTARQPHVRWVARMTKRFASIGVGKSASRDGGRTERPDHDPRPSPQRRPTSAWMSSAKFTPIMRATSPRRDNSPRAIARSRFWAALIRRGSRRTPRRACRPRRLRTPPLDPRRPTRLLRAIPASTSVIRLLHAVGVVMPSGSAAEDTTAKGH
jgi:hypothetical protein